MSAENPAMTAVRKLDDFGRVVISREMREALAWNEDEELVVEVQEYIGGKCVMLRKAVPRCSLCKRRDEPIQIFRKGFICQSCKWELAR